MEVKIPPMTTVASGCCTSAPGPVERAMGTKPKEATSAVMSLGRSRVTVPSTTARRSGRPSARSWLMKLISMMPLRTAMPDTAMKPIPAEIVKGMPRSQSASTPPIAASGTQVKTSAA